ncbi:RAD55 family ATPase [Halorientalis regularis]|jgi:KaiC/GvpD/RAD55 family RecA-like ATPase|uniref:RecA-superfamily ATPase, KaiC/GvpD/RAD55 family n=1 Tax=Halorientalis regularis TaxID=660518 RepID=A0A1G7I7Q0_9EURY|nr:HTR-like protein [Halorientalis regularis]SDF08623.1 RecA-superfamily ATPase, KaiC/GvpD/RAD55 family [Halorientalis regularis]
MDRIPFGIRQLDTIIDGGAPPGSVVLLSGEAGAGSREFMYTSAILNGLANADRELHDLYYGDVAAGASVTDDIHYVSFTADSDQLYREMDRTMDTEIVESGFEAVDFVDMAESYFHPSSVPRDWYAEETRHIRDMAGRQDREDIFTALGAYLSENAPGSLVVIDSLSDLISSLGDDRDWSDIVYIVKGLQKAAHSWNGLILVHVNHETVTPEQQGQLIDAANGTMTFEWEQGGSERARTLVFKKFRGVLSRIEDENIIRFETEIGDAGFDISDVRKIR